VSTRGSGRASLGPLPPTAGPIELLACTPALGWAGRVTSPKDDRHEARCQHRRRPGRDRRLRGRRERLGVSSSRTPGTNTATARGPSRSSSTPRATPPRTPVLRETAVTTSWPSPTTCSILPTPTRSAPITATASASSPPPRTSARGPRSCQTLRSSSRAVLRREGQHPGHHRRHRALQRHPRHVGSPVTSGRQRVRVRLPRHRLTALKTVQSPGTPLSS